MNAKKNSAYIQTLIEKYELGKSSLEEERELKHYFSQEEIATEFAEYKPEFQAFQENFSTLNVSEGAIAKTLSMMQDSEQEEKKEGKNGFKLISLNRYVMLAASVLLLMLSYMLGYYSGGNSNSQEITSNSSEDIQSLKQEMLSMKEIMVQNFLDQKYNHQKLYALTLASQLDSVNGEILDKVFTTLNHDENVNIRLAAADMLYQFASYEEVQTGLVDAFSSQESPLVILELVRLIKSLDGDTSKAILDKVVKQQNLKDSVKNQIINTYKSI